MAVDSMLSHWLSMAVEDEVLIHDRLGHAVGRSMRVLYVDDGILGLKDLEWLQGDLNVLIVPFRWIFLMDNVAK